MKRKVWDDQMRDPKTIDQVTYNLETDEKDGMGYQMRDLKTIGQVHVRAEDGYRRWE